MQLNYNDVIVDPEFEVRCRTIVSHCLLYQADAKKFAQAVGLHM